ncbi:MAG TPA: hypothetical protein VE954_09040 [Oligoflexus sp.]|uniref:CBU_0592 family membrane protein n=1 Tax=Oligoflexus sp. TaxID=1971216 RepID=UPI002D2DC237|nr:hypothetical protein [Oligoflexus sp.]HYX33246.1 hypothetical protein [Oligoflexus sp.]
MAMTWDQLLSLVGAALLLSAYALQSLATDGAYKKTCVVMNLLGSVALTITAVVNNQIGFILLEGIWAIISAWSLVRIMLKRS